jgi:hypothetical protein
VYVFAMIPIAAAREEGVEASPTIVASLRDARQSGAIRKPWVETHGYRRTVATRREPVVFHPLSLV